MSGSGSGKKRKTQKRTLEDKSCHAWKKARDAKDGSFGSFLLNGLLRARRHCVCMPSGDAVACALLSAMLMIASKLGSSVAVTKVTPELERLLKIRDGKGEDVDRRRNPGRQKRPREACENEREGGIAQEGSEMWQNASTREAVLSALFDAWEYVANKTLTYCPFSSEAKAVMCAMVMLVDSRMSAQTVANVCAFMVEKYNHVDFTNLSDLISPSPPSTSSISKDPILVDPGLGGLAVSVPVLVSHVPPVSDVPVPVPVPDLVGTGFPSSPTSPTPYVFFPVVWDADGLGADGLGQDECGYGGDREDREDREEDGVQAAYTTPPPLSAEDWCLPSIVNVDAD